MNFPFRWFLYRFPSIVEYTGDTKDLSSRNKRRLVPLVDEWPLTVVLLEKQVLLVNETACLTISNTIDRTGEPGALKLFVAAG